MSEPEELAVTREMTALELAAAGLVSLAFALSFGLNYGVGNQVTYLIPALRLLDPTLLARDWFATQTTQYHPLFAQLGALLLGIDRSGRALALTLTASVTAAGFVLHRLARELAGGRAALATFAWLLALLFATGTRGPALTYVFDRELQPSTLSSCFLLGATLALTQARYFVSSVLLALCGLVHVNFLILCGPAFAVAHLLLGRAGLARRLMKQLALPALTLLVFWPMLRDAAVPAPDAELGRHIYLTIRAPHHFVLTTQLGDFAPLLAWQLLAAALVSPWLGVPEARPFARLSALIVGLGAVVWLGTLAALESERAAAVFSWRLAPHVELLLELVSVAAAVRVLTTPALRARYGRVARGAVVLGVALVLGAELWRDRIGPAKVVVALGSLWGAWWLLQRAARPGAALTALAQPLARTEPELLAAASLALLGCFAVGPLGRVTQHSSLFLPRAAASQSLARFMRERTAKQALFLTPPDDDSLRFFGERAIVVDWKGNPAVPREVLAWYRRIEDVTGVRGLTRETELASYDRLDPPRLETLRARYGFEYAVVRRGREGGFGYPHAFENDRYVVLKVGAAASP